MRYVFLTTVSFLLHIGVFFISRGFKSHAGISDMMLVFFICWCDHWCDGYMDVGLCWWKLKLVTDHLFFKSQRHDGIKPLSEGFCHQHMLQDVSNIWILSPAVLFPIYSSTSMRPLKMKSNKERIFLVKLLPFGFSVRNGYVLGKKLLRYIFYTLTKSPLSYQWVQNSHSTA